MWPVYLSIANLDKSVYADEDNLCLVGFVPALPYSTAELNELLDVNGISKSKGKEAIKLLMRYIEQKYLEELYSAIQVCHDTGPILLRVGMTLVPDKFLPFIFFIVEDNEGASHMLGTKNCRCNFPCRCCLIEKNKIYESNSNNFENRISDKDHIAFLSLAFTAQCKKFRNERLSHQELEALNYCVGLRIFPVDNAVLKMREFLPQELR
jgi:hypothetical protein